MQYSRWGRTSVLNNVRITLTDLYWKVLPMKPTSLLAFLTMPQQCSVAFRSLLIVIHKSFHG